MPLVAAAPGVRASYSRIYGLTVRSEFPVADWPPAEPAPADVEVRRARLTVPELAGEPHAARWDYQGGALQVAVQGVGRYSASGSLILVDAIADAKPEDVELYLTGAMFGALLHQRGLFPLHAAAVDLAGTAVAIAGPSGAGKSTLTATLVEGGATFLTDDSSVLEFSDGVSLWPGPSRLKLDHRSIGLLPDRPGALAPAGGTRGKFHRPVSSAAPSSRPVRLGRVYLLTDGSGPPRAERVVGLEAVAAIADQAHFLAFAVTMGLNQQVFQLAARAVNHVEVFRLIRPRGLEHLPAIVAAIRSGANQPTSAR